jgi:ribosomal protein S18 acetylase RimI-like enzyme
LISLKKPAAARRAAVATRIRGVQAADLEQVVDIDAGITGLVCGIGVRPDARLGSIATQLLDAICDGFRRLGVDKVRTLLARDNQLVLSFFRSQGMMAAPFIPLEKDLG